MLTDAAASAATHGAFGAVSVCNMFKLSYADIVCMHVLPDSSNSRRRGGGGSSSSSSSSANLRGVQYVRHVTQRSMQYALQYIALQLNPLHCNVLQTEFKICYNANVRIKYSLQSKVGSDILIVCVMHKYVYTCLML